MTTEILRSMLYRGSEVMREVAWVIFDEIHYMRDKVYTNFDRPHYSIIYFHLGDGIHLVVDEKGVFREDNFLKAMGSLNDSRGEDPANSMSGRNKQGKLKRIHSEEEKETVDTVFKNAISNLSEDDQGLPQIEHILPLLKRGIGIHHGGLLPILKEVIEILFQEGLIKVLFATETFSIGLNMPEDSSIHNRTKMSGRAGRRGLDDRGIVIMMCDEQLEPATAKNMVKGDADRLDSAFHLGYNMILNLMRVEGVSPEYMLEKCFFQFQTHANLPLLENELRELQRMRSKIVVADEELIGDYSKLKEELEIRTKTSGM
ncbi:hypothetical protein H4Q26_016357 [Puccinia striiformis f. sp. tritici PST-130]|nr:hypothetical protein H4Q26_016357 [Puccinia striiformis f. sp. tritici PST-130]